MSKLNAGESPLYVDISGDSDKYLRDQAAKKKLPMQAIMDELISLAKSKYKPDEKRKTKKNKTFAGVISSKNKEWIKKFVEKTELTQGELADMIVKDAIAGRL